jgi:hypothetical protein
MPPTTQPNWLTIARKITLCKRIETQDHNDNTPYVADCLVRHLLEHGWQAAIDLGWPENEIIIKAGIGTLKLSATEQSWSPTIPTPTTLKADPETIRNRLQTCSKCDRYDNSRCTVAGCNCTGQGFAERKFAQCP